MSQAKSAEKVVQEIRRTASSRRKRRFGLSLRDCGAKRVSRRCVGVKGFEDLVLKNTTEEALRRFAKLVDWPPHLTTKYPDVEAVAPAVCGA